VILQSNGYAFLASPTAASLYGSNSLLLTSDQLVSVASANNLLYLGGGLAASLYSPNSVVAAAPAIQLSASNVASLFGGLSIAAVTPGAVVAAAGTAVSVVADTWMDLSANKGDVRVAASAGQLLLSGAVATSVYGALSLNLATGNAPLTLDGGALSTLGRVNVWTASEGDMTLYAAGAASIQSQGTVKLEGSLVSLTAPNVGVAAATAVSVGSGNVYLDGDRLVEATASTLSLQGSNVLTISAPNGGLSLGSGSDAFFTAAVRASFIAGSQGVLTAGSTLELSAPTTSVHGTLSVAVKSPGSVVLSGDGGLASLYGAESVRVNTNPAATGGLLQLDTPGSVNVVAGDAASFYGANSLFLNSPGETSIYGGGYALRLVGAGSVAVMAGGTLDLAATGGYASLSSPAFVAGAAPSVLFTASAGDVTLLSPLQVSIAGGNSISVVTPNALVTADALLSLRSNTVVTASAPNLLLAGSTTASIFGGFDGLVAQTPGALSLTSTGNAVVLNAPAAAASVVGATSVVAAGDTVLLQGDGPTAGWISAYGANSLMASTNGFMGLSANAGLALYGANSINLLTPGPGALTAANTLALTAGGAASLTSGASSPLEVASGGTLAVSAPGPGVSRLIEFAP